MTHPTAPQRNLFHRLVVHPNCNVLRMPSIHASCHWRNAQSLQLCYCLEIEDLARNLMLPERQASQACDNLWQHSCFEAFFAVPGASEYCEFNFSPSTQWARYAFTSERVRDTRTRTWAAPQITTTRTDNSFTLDVLLERQALPPSIQGWRLGLSAVLEDKSEQLSYWALEHPCPVPDFHHTASRCLHLSAPEP